MPLVPAASDDQKASLPMPMGDTTPTPVMTISRGLAMGCTLNQGRIRR
jgi:hypothetical protein